MQILSEQGRGTMQQGTAAGIGGHLLACGWVDGGFYMEANLGKSEANLRLTAHGGWAASQAGKPDGIALGCAWAMPGRPKKVKRSENRN